MTHLAERSSANLFEFGFWALMLFGKGVWRLLFKEEEEEEDRVHHDHVDVSFVH